MGAAVSQDGKWVVGATATITATFVRPNDATQYTAGDVIADQSAASIANILRFNNIVRTPGGGGILQSAVLVDSVAAATKPDTELYLFDQIITMQSDNAAWAPLDSEMLYNVGVVAFPVGAFKTAGANGIIDVTGLGKAFNCASGSTTLYGVLVARNGYTPTAVEQFEIRLQVLQD
jgi:hypothetical protein